MLDGRVWKKLTKRSGAYIDGKPTANSACKRTKVMRLFSGSDSTVKGSQTKEVIQYSCCTIIRPNGYINRGCLFSIKLVFKSRYTVVNNYLEHTTPSINTPTNHYH